MLVKQFFGASVALFVVHAFRLAASEPRTPDLGLFGRLFPSHALLKSLQINHVTHARPLLLGIWNGQKVHDRATIRPKCPDDFRIGESIFASILARSTNLHPFHS
jgi:hypothetical protein